MSFHYIYYPFVQKVKTISPYDLYLGIDCRFVIMVYDIVNEVKFCGEAKSERKIQAR